MTILPIDPKANATPAAFADFLARCREEARKLGRPRLVSVSLGVDALDPLAVLESIFSADEKHFYAERPRLGWAVAGADAVLSFNADGPDRFASLQRFVDATLEDALVVADLDLPFSGPHFFSACAFAPRAEESDSFPAASIFVPRWQIGCAEGHTTATANLLIDENADVGLMAARVMRAHATFRTFDYSAPGFAPRSKPLPVVVSEVGGEFHFRDAVEKAIGMLRSSECRKIVLARAKDLRGEEPFHPLRALNGLRERFPDCYSFSVANGAGQSFIGASPERLLRVSNGELRTEALAGSTRRGMTASEDAMLGSMLLHAPKDLHEQRLVLDSIIRRLAPLGIVPEFADRPSLIRLANVQHLHTAVRAMVPSTLKITSMLEALHPTPAVGGSPREFVLPLIRQLEGFSRGLYAGALGWFDAKGGGEFFVGIRSATIDECHARVYAGAGIVPDSTPDREYAETELKFRPMMEALLE